MGTSRGKLGNMVLARRNGKEIQRAYISQVANPKSIGQQYQRMVFATGSAAMKALSGIVDHSFEGIKYGQDSRSYFMSETLKMLRSKMRYSATPGTPQARYVGAYNIKGAGVYVPNAYKVAEGSLYINPYVLGEASVAMSAGVSFYDNEVTTAELEGNITSKADYESLLNRMFGCAPGDQVTFIFVGTDDTNAAEFGNAYNKRTFVQVARVIFKEWSEGMSGALIVNDKFSTEFIDTERSLNYGGLIVYVAGDDSLNVATIASPIEIVSVGCIISRPNGTSWKRSTSYMAGRFVYAQGPDVVASYGDSASENLPSDYYLNNGLTSNTEADTAIPAPEPEPEEISVVGLGVGDEPVNTALVAIQTSVTAGSGLNVAVNLTGSPSSVDVAVNGSAFVEFEQMMTYPSVWEMPTQGFNFNVGNNYINIRINGRTVITKKVVGTE